MPWRRRACSRASRWGRGMLLSTTICARSASRASAAAAPSTASSSAAWAAKKASRCSARWGISTTESSLRRRILPVEREGRPVEVQRLPGEIILQPLHELEQHLVRVGDHQRPVRHQLQAVKLGLDVGIQGLRRRRAHARGPRSAWRARAGCSGAAPADAQNCSRVGSWASSQSSTPAREGPDCRDWPAGLRPGSRSSPGTGPAGSSLPSTQVKAGQRQGLGIVARHRSAVRHVAFFHVYPFDRWTAGLFRRHLPGN